MTPAPDRERASALELPETQKLNSLTSNALLRPKSPRNETENRHAKDFSLFVLHIAAVFYHRLCWFVKPTPSHNLSLEYPHANHPEEKVQVENVEVPFSLDVEQSEQVLSRLRLLPVFQCQNKVQVRLVVLQTKHFCIGAWNTSRKKSRTRRLSVQRLAESFLRSSGKVIYHFSVVCEALLENSVEEDRRQCSSPIPDTGNVCERTGLPDANVTLSQFSHF